MVGSYGANCIVWCVLVGMNKNFDDVNFTFSFFFKETNSVIRKWFSYETYYVFITSSISTITFSLHAEKDVIKCDSSIGNGNGMSIQLECTACTIFTSVSLVNYMRKWKMK